MPPKTIATAAAISGHIFHEEVGAGGTYRVISTGPVRLLGVNFDNTVNTSADCWLKFYDTATPTVGTTVPWMILRVRKGTVLRAAFRGFTSTTALSVAVVSAGGTGGTSSPGQDATLKVSVAS